MKRFSLKNNLSNLPDSASAFSIVVAVTSLVLAFVIVIYSLFFAAISVKNALVLPAREQSQKVQVDVSSFKTILPKLNLPDSLQ